ncbi:hypothetical protein MTR62_15350 [Novosphingobium sp. 1949]|uniref:NACHT C-terminal Alpha/Beta 2 domain-containing protein n=1 Tax=Novosphingobium organovorum TaxID=2930092 RepID=A0ABT0BG68_9SPHN|nr:hypothetical protein [Novosphingobium organovorum]MCJ2184060.1 hypothetical protein [Novosphingobium organovorum]
MNQIAKRAGWLCSFPSCRALTVGATEDGDGEINLGTAAHICAAAPGGPRYDEKMTPEQRSSAENGIWMCRDHGKAIDSDEKAFTVGLLREWKRQVQEDSWRRVLRNEAPPAPQSNDDLHARLRDAATADLSVFRNTAKWPSTSVPLTLEVEGLSEPVTTNAIARAVVSLDDLVLVAPPGMGKTTTLFQIAEAMLTDGGGIPLIVPLGDWATEETTVLGSILKRPALRDISEADFRAAASLPGMVLLLDGWNELDADARRRARIQVETLKAELPELGLIISTRRQALDVPFAGTRVDLLPLSEEQQMQIAVAMRGDAGAKIVDQAWRTSGVRDLVTIPLYLSALLLLPENASFPTTKEEVLRHFVAAHENDAGHAEALHAVARGFQGDFLGGLADFASHTANTAISDSNARSSISETGKLLVQNGQLTLNSQPDPGDVLDVLVNSHVLMRAGDTPGVSFQHQQLQEWYASHTVERRIISEVDDSKGREALKADIFNLPVWEEAILFAVERMARSGAPEKAACGKAILAAFEVDPILAAEMIYRATDDVWASVSTTIQEHIGRWHAPGKCDRAFRFMMNSGRPEFLDHIWPLITHENDQVSLKALRNCRRFRPSLLGQDAKKRIGALLSQVRAVLLHEMAFHGGMDGLDLAMAVAKNDSDPEVQASVVDALAFRRADRHIVELLQGAKDATFDLVARKNLFDEVNDEAVQQRITAARKRHEESGMSTYDRLHSIIFASDITDKSGELTAIITEMEIENRQDAAVRLIYEAWNRYPRAVADGLLARVRAGRTLFYGADDILARAGFALEDDDLLRFALAETGRLDNQAEAAASVLGPQSVGRMIDALLDAGTRLRDADGKYDKTAADRYHCIQSRIAHVPGVSLVAATWAHSAEADNEQIERLAELLSRHPDEADRGRPFDAESLTAIRALIEDWGNRVLSSSDAERRHIASVASLARRAPDVSLLPLLKRMLDENLRRYRAFREEAAAEGWRQGKAQNEASWPLTQEYMRAFMAIKSPETTALMCEYLADPHFGELAACVLADHWKAANEPPPNKRFFGGPDFSGVAEKRAVHAADPGATSDAAEAIFSVIETLIADGATDDQKRLAAELGIVAVRLPHGQRNATIEKLISLTPRRTRSKLLFNLILSGAEIDSKFIIDGVAETLEAAKTHPWMLMDNQDYELREWLRLSPFTNQPAVALDIVQNMPAAQQEPRFLEGMVDAFAASPSAGAEEALFDLAEQDQRFYENYQWRASALKLGTISSAQRLIELTAQGVFDAKSVDKWRWSRELGTLIERHPEVRRQVYDSLKSGVTSPALTLLAKAVAENPDDEGLLLLIDIEIKQKQPMLDWRSIEAVVTEHIPVENWCNAYNVVPVPAAELRQTLLARTTDGGPEDAAARCLTAIDLIRDERGVPMTEPRHPDLASGKPWPIMKPDPNATAD